MSCSENYYEVLGVQESASQSELKSAYKRLALRYHPDKNTDSQYAEEQFKAVNEAYRTLSDLSEKRKYDELLSKSRVQPYSKYTAYKKGATRSAYERYGIYDLRVSSRNTKTTSYKIDKQYYKVQAYTIGVFIIASAIIFGGSAIRDYYNEQQRLKEKAYIDLLVSKAAMHYRDHAYDSAFIVVKKLIKEFPYEKRFSRLRNEYAIKTMNKGMVHYSKKKYREAILSLGAVIKHSRQLFLEAWMVIGECHFHLKNYQKAIHAFEYVSLRDANNLKLIIRIGDIQYLLVNYQQALDQYNRAKSIFTNRHSKGHGKDIELVGNPDYLDTVYFHLFDVRGKANIKLGNYEEAITDYNWVIYLDPNNLVSYRKRGECYLKIGNVTQACNDLKVAFRKGDQKAKVLFEQFCVR